MMSLRVLTLDSVFDLPTTYLAYWMSKIAEGARRMGHQVLSLRGGDATINNLTAAIDSYNPQFLFIGGHGNEETITTTNLQPLIVACTNDQILSNRQTYFISCLTGVGLVPSVVSKKGIAAAGFTAEYVWVVSPPYLPAQDIYAKPFERMIVKPALEVLRTGSWSSWYNKLQSVGDEEEAAWLRRDDPLASQVVLSIRQDRNAATFVSTEEEQPGGLDISTLVVAGYVLKALLGG